MTPLKGCLGNVFGWERVYNVCTYIYIFNYTYIYIYNYLYIYIYIYIYYVLKGYALCRQPLEVHVCVKLGSPTDAGAGVQSVLRRLPFCAYYGNKQSKMYLIKGSLEV